MFHVQAGGMSKYKCHLCDKVFSWCYTLTLHLRKKHELKWPSGHSRFRSVTSPETIFGHVNESKWRPAKQSATIQCHLCHSCASDLSSTIQSQMSKTAREPKSAHQKVEERSFQQISEGKVMSMQFKQARYELVQKLEEKLHD